jgi:hypothetical protein
MSYAEGLAQDLDGVLVGIELVGGEGVEALTVEGGLARRCVGDGEVDADDEVGGLEAGFAQGLLHLLDRLESVLYRFKVVSLSLGLLLMLVATSLIAVLLAVLAPTASHFFSQASYQRSN